MYHGGQFLDDCYKEIKNKSYLKIMKANELVAIKSRKVQNLEKEMVKNNVKIDNSDKIWLRSKVKRIASQLL